ncbi:hypothetical protein BN946_scf184970.g42 [Trametes cinnabarina]|uniref:Uncharacterized protein n=1 Tax=Pycnoporus cinnabarinus TaxID=5643 RepID=A0A060SCV1_PYCCI|nr:hypothetical protein BN946_scf184970.g42 [Trametes cinnabarina]
MASILERLRKRTLSQQRSTSLQLVLEPAPPPFPTTAIEPSIPATHFEPSLVDRRIVQDLPALLHALEREQDDPSGGLKPPRARKRSGLARFVLNRSGDDAPRPESTSKQTAEKENDEHSPTSRPASARSTQSKGKGRSFASSRKYLSAATSPWSTFGRQRTRSGTAPYRPAHPPPSGSRSRDSTVYGPSSSNADDWLSMSNLASTSSIGGRQHGSSQDQIATSAQSNISHSSDAGSKARYSVHTFGANSPSERDVQWFPPGSGSPCMTQAPLSRESASLSMHVQGFHLSPESGDLTRSRMGQLSVSTRPATAFDGTVTHFEPQQFTHDGMVSPTQSEQHADDQKMQGESKTDSKEHVVSPPPSPQHSSRSARDGSLLLSAIAEPHAQHASSERTDEPCSPSRFIPPSSPFPTSPTLLDGEQHDQLGELVLNQTYSRVPAENRSDGVSDNLSRSSSYTNPAERRGDNGWMAEPRDATNTLNSRRSIDTRDLLKKGSIAASRPGSHIRVRSRRSSQLSEPSTPTASTSKENGGAGLSSTAFPTDPETPTPVRVSRTPRTASEPGLRSVSEKSVLETPVNQKGKRKAEEVDLTPPDQRTGQHATFVLPEGGHRSHHASEISRAPSSFNGRKRARLSTASPSASPGQSRPASVSRHPTDSWPNRSANPSTLHRSASKTASMRSGMRPESMIAAVHRNAERRRSLSEISIPISALVAPHAPSMSVRSSMYHMRDPRRPRVHPTPWYLERRTADQEGSPVQAWFFFLGFILFPLWYVASFWRIPKTRQVGGTDTEKAVTLDDPQVEHVSLFTYIPFIVLVAIFVPRS